MIVVAEVEQQKVNWARREWPFKVIDATSYIIIIWAFV